MSNWKTVRVGEVCKSVSSGGTPKSNMPEYYEGGDIPWLNTKEVNFNRIYSTEKYITSSGLQNSAAKWIEKNSIIVAMYGATAGKVAVTKIPLTTNQACCNLTIDSNLADYRFVYYHILNNYTQLASLANGGAQQNLNSNHIKDFPILLPSLEEQERIAGILGALDDKIEYNNRINRNLEEQAAALFRRWFVDFEFPNSDGTPYRSSGGTMQDSPLGSIPQGWQVKLLGELCHVITKGTTPTTLKKSFVDSGINFVKAESISDSHCIDKNKIAFIDTETHELLKRSIIRSQDILFTIAGTIGRFCMIVEGDVPANTNQAVAIIRVNDEIISPFVIYSFFIDGWHTKFYDSRIQQAVQANLSLTSIRELPILLPDINSLNLYQGLIYPLFKSIEKNNKENQTLAILRDSLLPKLMNNEI